MQAVLLRPERCVYCGGAMSSVGRIDRRYCKESCRTLAYRHRKRTGEPAKRRERILKWAEGQPLVIGSALAALADLQGRVAAMAHQLEKDDIAFRHPYPAERAQATTDQAAADRVEELREALRQTQADKISAEDRARELSQEVAAVRAEARQFQEQHARLVEQVQRAEEKPRQAGTEISALRAELAAANRRADEATSKLEKTERALAKKTEHHQQDVAYMNEASRAAGRMREEVARTTAQLHVSAQKIRELEAEVAEGESLADELRAAKRANQQMQAEIEKLRPSPAEADPLVKLMKQKVVAWHLLAQYDAKYQRKGRGPLFSNGPELTGRPLARDDEPTILKAAVQAALEARRGFFYRTHGPYTPKPRWITDDRLLDPTSEKTLLDEEQLAIEALAGWVSMAQNRSGG